MTGFRIDEADLAHCRGLLAGGSKSFHAASLLLPRRIAAPATALYAFCRVADDEIDLSNGKQEALARLNVRLDAAYAGTPQDDPVDRAFAAVVAHFGIPRTLPEALLEGLAWDAAGLRYADMAALEAYATRVAGTVGAMMTLLMGVRDPRAIARACDLGLGMQLTNIARDVGEDAREGRLYLPLDWLAEEGIAPEDFLAAPAFTPAIARLVARLLAAADAHYARAAAGIALLPRDCRAGIGAARVIYAEIGRELERNGLDSICRRAVVPGWRKAVLLARAAGALVGRAQGAGEPPCEAASYLVDAVADAPYPPGLIPRGWGNRLVWALEVMDRIDRERGAERPMNRTYQTVSGD
ncbi:phytoene/squalene synthase family protein [Neoroseomonas rubea]|uniref:phytoene/squalene synthase family protein n=1 Tax=Neoroseomonas rubea TaxID=2748666 RepID=UPI0018DEFCDA|nr:phytoene/squalene synthase family protein [Roseomonas rubea]